MATLRETATGTQQKSLKELAGSVEVFPETRVFYLRNTTARKRRVTEYECHGEP
jgi:hypothetical protein